MMQSWTPWQSEVVALLHGDFEEMLHHVGMDGVEWASWRSIYLEGSPPATATRRMFERLRRPGRASADPDENGTARS